MSTVETRSSRSGETRDPAGPALPAGAGPLPAGLLERAVGRPRDTWTEDDLAGFAMGRGVRVVSLMHVGGDGWLKTLDFVPRDRGHFSDILLGGERADGSSLFTGMKSGASDMVLRPRLDTAFLDPFSSTPTLVLLADHYDRDGKPLAESPPAILRRAYERAQAESGVDLWALGEVEYFLGKRPDVADVAPASDRGYHAASPFVFGEELRREALVALAEMGVAIKYGHSEVGALDAEDGAGWVWEQHEIELALAPLPRAADAVALTRWVLQNLAHRRGWRLTFDPMLREGHAGNGLHFHMGPRVDGAFAGVDDEGAPAGPGRWLIGGLTRVAGALMAFGNRDAGSFTRLRQGKEAPSMVTWGRYDRRALIRLPVSARFEDGRHVSPPTIEFRLGDGSAHPHLLLAGIAQAMTFGRSIPDLDAWLESTASRRNAGAGTGAALGTMSLTGESGAARVPGSRAQVAEALEAHRAAFEAGEVFPDGLLDRTLTDLRSR